MTLNTAHVEVFELPVTQSYDLAEFTNKERKTKRLRMHVSIATATVTYEVFSGGFSCGTFVRIEDATEAYNAR